MNNLEELRNEIDLIDDQLLELLDKRISVMKKVGDAKKEEHLTIRDYHRESKKLLNIQQKAAMLGIPDSLVKNIWKLFFEISEEIEL